MRTQAAPGHVAITLDYPRPLVHEDVGDPPGDFGADLTYRPSNASAGSATFDVGGRSVTVNARPGGVFDVPAPSGTEVGLKAGAVRDQWGNANGEELAFQP